jgi:hypothetical protein
MRSGKYVPLKNWKVYYGVTHKPAICSGSRDSVFGTENTLQAGRSGIRILVEEIYFSLSQNIQTGSEAMPPPVRCVLLFFPGCKSAGADLTISLLLASGLRMTTSVLLFFPSSRGQGQLYITLPLPAIGSCAEPVQSSSSFTQVFFVLLSTQLNFRLQRGFVT